MKGVGVPEKSKEKAARGEEFVRITQHHSMDFNIQVIEKV